MGGAGDPGLLLAWRLGLEVGLVKALPYVIVAWQRLSSGRTLRSMGREPVYSLRAWAMCLFGITLFLRLVVGPRLRGACDNPDSSGGVVSVNSGAEATAVDTFQLLFRGAFSWTPATSADGDVSVVRSFCVLLGACPSFNSESPTTEVLGTFFGRPLLFLGTVSPSSATNEISAGYNMQLP